MSLSFVVPTIAGAQPPQDSEITVRAVRVRAPVRIDGRLDEEMYGVHAPITGFVQQEPDEGTPATEKTDAWVFFDDDNVYVSARCWETHPERRVANVKVNRLFRS